PSTSPYDLSFALVTTAEGLSGAFGYRTDLFEHATIERLAGQFQVLLQGIVARPDTAVGQLPLLEAAGREQWAAVERNRTPAAEAPQPRGEYVAPRTPTEEALARIWSEVLRLPRVSVRDNFFDLGGGHSLLVIQVIARVRELFEVEIPITAIFQ